jgi:hypothetical protein
MMKLLLIIAAVLEAATGLALLILPAWAVSILLGVPLETPAGLVAGHIAGAGIFALAIACWQARNGERGSPATGVVKGLLFYYFAVAAVLVYAGIFLSCAVRCFGRRSFCILVSVYGVWLTSGLLSGNYRGLKQKLWT